MRRNKNKQQSKPSNRVRIRTKYNQNVTVNPSSTATNLGELTTSNSGIWSLNNQVSSLSDMFRLFKINDLVLEFSPQYTTAGTAVNVPCGMLVISLSGQTNPTDMQANEGPLQSNLALPWGATTTGNSETILRDQVAKLAVKNKDLPILQGSSTPGDAGYLATQDDGTQTSYGRLFWLLASAATSTTLNYLLRTYFDLDFKDILDPSTISSHQSERAAQAVAYHVTLQSQGHFHIEFSDGTLERAIQMHLKVNRQVLLGSPSPVLEQAGETTPQSENSAVDAPSSLSSKLTRLLLLQQEIAAIQKQ